MSEFAIESKYICAATNRILCMFIKKMVGGGISFISNTEKSRVRYSWTINESMKFYGIEFGKNVKSPLKENIFSDFFNKMKVSDYLRKSESFRLQRKIWKFLLPIILSCKKQQHIHSAHNNTSHEIFQTNSLKWNRRSSPTDKILWSLFMCSSKDIIKVH